MFHLDYKSFFFSLTPLSIFLFCASTLQLSLNTSTPMQPAYKPLRSSVWAPRVFILAVSLSHRLMFSSQFQSSFSSPERWAMSEMQLSPCCVSHHCAWCWVPQSSKNNYLNILSVGMQPNTWSYCPLVNVMVWWDNLPREKMHTL